MADVENTPHRPLPDEHSLFGDADNLEAKFYQEGYDGGFAHGRLHGLFEGRALGQEKAWEIWEEVGFYEGFAEYWMGVLGGTVRVGAGRGKEARAIQQTRQLLDLIASFPTTNPTPAPASTDPNSIHLQTAAMSENSNTNITSNQSTDDQLDTEETDPTDLPRLLSTIRAKYKLLCMSVGARPRLVAAPTSAASDDATGVEYGGSQAQGIDTSQMAGAGNGEYSAEGVLQGIQGPMKGVDTRQLRF